MADNHSKTADENTEWDEHSVKRRELFRMVDQVNTFEDVAWLVNEVKRNPDRYFVNEWRHEEDDDDIPFATIAAALAIATIKCRRLEQGMPALVLLPLTELLVVPPPPVMAVMRPFAADLPAGVLPPSGQCPPERRVPHSQWHEANPTHIPSTHMKYGDGFVDRNTGKRLPGRRNLK